MFNSEAKTNLTAPNPNKKALSQGLQPADILRTRSAWKQLKLLTLGLKSKAKGLEDCAGPMPDA